MFLGLDLTYIAKILPKFIKILPYTILIILLSATLGLFLTMVITAIRLKKIRIIHELIEVYLSFFRSTPGIIHLFLVYYGLPILFQQFGLNINGWSRSAYSILALVLFNGAYLSEILRPAYLSVGKGQQEAADSIGLSGFKKVWRIILPQAIPIALPNLGNALIDLIKDTSILFVIGLVDIMGKAKLLIANDYGVKKLEVYLVVGFIYWVLIFIADSIIKAVEHKYGITYKQK